MIQYRQKFNIESMNLEIENLAQDSIFIDNKEKYMHFLEIIFGDKINKDIFITLADKIIYRLNVNSSFIEKLKRIFCEFDNGNLTNMIYDIYNVIEIWIKKLDETLNTNRFHVNDTLDLILNSIIEKAKTNSQESIIISILQQLKEEYLERNTNEYRIKLQFTAAIFYLIYESLDRIEQEVSNIHIGNYANIKSQELTKNIDSIYNKLKEHKFYNETLVNKVIDKIENYNGSHIIVKGKRDLGKSTLIANVKESLINKSPCYQIIAYSLSVSTNLYDMMEVIIEECNIRLINKINLNILEKVRDEKDSIEKYRRIIVEVFQRLLKENKNILLVIDSIDDTIKDIEEFFKILLEIKDYISIVLVIDSVKEDSLLVNNSDCIYMPEITLEEVNLITQINNEELNKKVLEISGGRLELIINEIKILNSLNDNEKEEYIKKEFINNITEFENQAEIWIEENNNGLEEILLLLSMFNSINVLDMEEIESFLNFKNFNYRLPQVRKMINKIKMQVSINAYTKIKLNENNFANYILNKYFGKTDIRLFTRDIFNWFGVLDNINTELFIDFLSHIKNSKIITKSDLDSYIDIFIKESFSRGRDNILLKIAKKIIYRSEEFEKIGIRFLQKAIEMNNCKAKSFLGIYYFNIKNSDYDKGEQLLLEAIEEGNLEGKIFMANLLLDGIKVKKDSEKGIKLLEEAVNLGDNLAQLYMAERLISGQGISRNEDRSIELFEGMINNGNQDAIIRLGSRLLDGAGIEKNIKYGQELLLKAVELDNLYAKLEYASRIITADGFDKDIEKGLKLLKDIANDGNNQAKLLLAKVYIYGIGIKTNINEGMSFLNSLVEEKYEDAIIMYSNLLIEGYIIDKDIEKGIELLKESLKRGNIEAMEILGIKLIDGEDIKVDTERGIKLLNEAIQKGSTSAKVQLANRYFDGISVERNEVLAREMFEELISVGDLYAIEQYGIRLTNTSKNDIEKHRGIKLVKKAIEQGSENAKLFWADKLIEGQIIDKNLDEGEKILVELSKSGVRRAKRKLGLRLLEGLGIKQDIVRGESLLIEDVENGDIKSKIILGNSIISGDSTIRSKKEAISWFEEIGERDIDAIRILGVAKIQGLIIEQDKIEGERLLRLAISKGDFMASRILGHMLIDGIYVEKNCNEGIKLLKNAAKFDNELALFEYAKRLFNGDGIKKDVRQSEKIILDLIERSISDAVIFYVNELIKGKSITKNIVKAKELLEKKCEENETYAKRMLAEKVLEGSITGYSTTEAIKLLEKNIDEDDDVWSMASLAEYLIKGKYVCKDIEKASSLLERASNKNCNYAKFMYASELKTGLNLKQDIAKAEKLFEELIQNGKTDATLEYSKDLIYGMYYNRNALKGEEILKALVQNGWNEAKNEYALMLIKGDGIEKNCEYGLMLLENQVKENNEDALIQYSDLLFDGIYIEKNTKKGEALLKQAIKNGSKRACHAIANRLIDGDGLKKHVTRAKKYYNRARQENRLADFEYGVRIKNGRGFNKDIKRGEEIIKDIIGNNTNERRLYDFAIIAYKNKDFKLASDLFFQAYEYNIETANISLAYMIRRNEYDGRKIISSIEELLCINKKNYEYIAKINYVINIIQNCDSEDEWRKGDSIISNLGYYNSKAEWWYDTSKYGDGEGNLVIGWLGRHGLINNEDNITFVERLNRAKSSGFNVPDWMFIKATEAQAEVACTTEINISI